MFDSVRTRLTLWYAAVLALSLIVFGLLVYYAAARIFYERQEESLRSTAETVASAYMQELEEEGSIAKANEVVLAEMVFPNRYVEVVDPEGKPVAYSSNLNARTFSLPTQTLNEANQRRVSFVVQNNLRIAVVPLSSDRSQRLGFATVAESLSVIQEGLARLRKQFYAGVPIILALATLGGYFLARKSLAPISLMNQQTHRITAENLSARLDVPNPRDEVGRLALTINSLLERLDAAFNEQQRFVADASHELRTPLAVLRGEAEIALNRNRVAEEYRQSLELIKDEAESLTRIVENLFILSREPLNSASPLKAPLRLNDVVAECTRAARVLATQKGLRLSTDGVLPEMDFDGDDELLKRVLLNLFDNAVKYTASGGEIKVLLARENGHACIVVSDTGIGIPQSDQPRIFDRFYRVDKTRSRALGGAGLGLSIARLVVEAHGGSISVESTVGHGSVFTICLPLNNERRIQC